MWKWKTVVLVVVVVGVLFAGLIMGINSLRWKAASSYNDQGMGALERGDLAEAERLFRLAIGVHSKHPVALYNMAFVEEERELYDVAVSLYKRSLEADPTFCAAYNNLGRRLREDGDLQGALEVLEAGLECSDPLLEEEGEKAVSASLHRNLGITQYELGQLEQARYHLGLAAQQEASLSVEWRRGETYWYYALALEGLGEEVTQETWEGILRYCWDCPQEWMEVARQKLQ